MSERIMLTGKAQGWQQDSRELSCFGSLLDNMEHNSENDLLTDSRSKTYLIRKDDQNKMIDRVMELPEYRFYCHEQIRTELARHDMYQMGSRSFGRRNKWNVNWRFR